MKKELKISGQWEDGDEYVASQKTYDVRPDDAIPYDLHFYKDTGLTDTVFLLKDRKDITIDFNGATLMLHGKL